MKGSSTEILMPATYTSLIPVAMWPAALGASVIRAVHHGLCRAVSTRLETKTGIVLRYPRAAISAFHLSVQTIRLTSYASTLAIYPQGGTTVSVLTCRRSKTPLQRAVPKNGIRVARSVVTGPTAMGSKHSVSPWMAIAGPMTLSCYLSESTHRWVLRHIVSPTHSPSAADNFR